MYIGDFCICLCPFFRYPAVTARFFISAQNIPPFGSMRFQAAPHGSFLYIIATYHSVVNSKFSFS